MSQLGVGAMLHYLGGGSQKDPKEYYGKKIKAATFASDNFAIEFEDGVKIKITDNGQSCCESRYMVCDDNPAELEGQILIGIEVKDVNPPHADYCKKEYCDVHDVAFLEIQDNHSSITFSTHNIHNGYYGGFGLNVSEVET